MARESLVPVLGVLISGRGSNLQALIDAEREGRLGARIAVVISNRADAAGLERARAAGIDTLVRSHAGFASREQYDQVLVAELRKWRVTLVCLAGFMRLVSPAFCGAFPNAILNIHPSLLPAFPGEHAQRQALSHGVKVTGATVHFVTPELDAGPILLQEPVPVNDDDTVESLSARILAVEHRIYPAAVRLVLSRAWRVDGRRVVWDGADRGLRSADGSADHKFGPRDDTSALFLTVRRGFRTWCVGKPVQHGLQAVECLARDRIVRPRKRPVRRGSRRLIGQQNPSRSRRARGRPGRASQSSDCRRPARPRRGTCN